jgi:hypothetical protein
VVLIAILAVRLPDTGPVAVDYGDEQENGFRDPLRMAGPRVDAYLPDHPQPPAWTPEPTVQVEVESLSSDGVPCSTTDTGDRPVLNTVRPTLTARMTSTESALFEIVQLPNILVTHSADQTLTQDHVSLYLRGPWRLRPGESYSWRVGDRNTDVWSKPCEFTIAETALDSLNLPEDRSITVSLPPSRWRAVIEVLDQGWPYDQQAFYRSIQGAGVQPTDKARVTLRGRDWGTVVGAVAEKASARNDPGLWNLVDALSSKAGGPPHPTMGLPRS